MLNIFPYIFAFVLTLYFINIFIPIARKINLTDRPTERKKHEGDVPLVGGMAMFLGVIFALLTMRIPLSELRGLMLALLILIITGVLDDFKDLKPKSKLIAQITSAVIIATWGGVSLHSLGNLAGFGDISLHDWSIPFTIVCIVGVTNAINMVDGIDGLAGTLSLIAFIFLLGLTIYSGRLVEMRVLLLFITVLLAFLIYNIKIPGRHNAAVFMGDAGSMFLGFSLAWFFVSLSQGERPAFSPVTALWIFAVPLFDMFGIMIRRLLKGQSVTRPDREHLHHIFESLGLSVNQSVLVLATIAVCYGLAGVVMHLLGVDEWIMFSIFIGLFVIYVWGLRHIWRVLKFIKKIMRRRV